LSPMGTRETQLRNIRGIKACRGYRSESIAANTSAATCNA